MRQRANLIYSCEESLAGILCCVYESYTRKEIPEQIIADGTPSFIAPWQVPLDEAHARRVWMSLERMGGEVADWVEDCWYSCIDDRLDLIFRFIRLVYEKGRETVMMLDHEIVSRVWGGVLFIRREAHQLMGFVRFSDYDGVLVSVIEPKSMVLPLLRGHFTDRYLEECFMIYDRVHNMALVYRPYESVIRPVEDLQLPAPDEKEAAFRAMWKQYYFTAGIKERQNERCRMNHMPKRFWNCMTEFEKEILGVPRTLSLTGNRKSGMIKAASNIV